MQLQEQASPVAFTVGAVRTHASHQGQAGPPRVSVLETALPAVIAQSRGPANKERHPKSPAPLNPSASGGSSTRP